MQVSVALVGRRTEIDDGIAHDLARRSVQTFFVPGVRGFTRPAGAGREASSGPPALEPSRAVLVPWRRLGAAAWGRPSVSTDHLPMLRNRRLWELVRRLANRKLSGLVRGRRKQQRRRAPALGLRTPIHVVHNAVEPVPFSERRLAEGEPLRLLFLGRLDEQKDPLFVVAVADALRRRGVDFRLSIAGSGPLSEAVRERVGELELGDLVELAGFVSPPWDEYARAHVLLTPARFEGAPLVPLEALSSGLPVLGSDIGPHADLAAVKQPSECCRRATRSRGSRRSCGSPPTCRAEPRRARDPRARSVESMIDAVLDVYRGVLARA